jgi:hypothetical protein
MTRAVYRQGRRKGVCMPAFPDGSIKIASLMDHLSHLTWQRSVIHGVAEK